MIDNDIGQGMYFSGSSPIILHELIHNNASIDELKETISSLPETLISRDKRGRLPLHIACEQRYSEYSVCPLSILNMLLIAYVKLDLPHELEVFFQDVTGQSPLCHAASRSDQYGASMCEAILNHFPGMATYVNEQMRTPLHCYRSGTSDSINIVRVLTKFSPKAASMMDCFGRTPLHMLFAASPHPSLEEILVLTEACPASVFIEDASQKSPIIHAWESFVRSQDARMDRGNHITFDSNKMEHTEFFEIINALCEIGLREVCGKEKLKYSRAVEVLAKLSVYQAAELFQFLTSAMSKEERKYLVHISATAIRGWGAIYGEVSTPILEQVLEEMGESCLSFVRLKDAHGNLPLHVASKSVPCGPNWCLSQEENISYSSNIELLLQVDKGSAKVNGEKGRLPLHWAIASGMTFENGVLELIQAFQGALLESDPVTQLKPFMMAALTVDGHNHERSEYSLDDVYRLLQANPCAVTVDYHQLPISKKRNCSKSGTAPRRSIRNKRRRLQENDLRINTMCSPTVSFYNQI